MLEHTAFFFLGFLSCIGSIVGFVLWLGSGKTNHPERFPYKIGD